MKKEQMIQYALEENFADAAVVDTREITFDPSFRPYCEENLCGQYNANYSCPTVCGTPEEMKNKVLAYKHALVLETIWEVPDYTDKDVIKKVKTSHNAAALRLAKKLRGQGCDGFLVGASGCALCTPCAMTKNEPCRFPEQMYSCMSAYCIFVRELTEKCGMEYNCGDGLLAFFGMYVFDELD